MEINDLQKWYFQLDERAEQVKQYEDTIFKFNEKINSNIDYTKPLLKGFYNKEKFNKYLPKFLFNNISFILLFTIVSTIVAWSCFTMCKHTDPIIAITKHGLDNIKPSLLIGLLSFIIIILFVIFSNLYSFSLMKSKLAKQEILLLDLIKTVPPNFRSYDRINTLARVYFTRQNLKNDVAFSICEEVVIKNSENPFLKIMFDVPYENPLLEGTIKKQEEINNMNNPNLPQDIKSKTLAGSDNSVKDLEAMIGLDSVKQQIKKLENRIKFYGNSNNNGNHMSFMGSAGTGKTTVARIITKILYDLGYIKKNQYVEISGDYLRSGSTARASAIIEYSIGGVLFIDEAYLLYDKNGQGTDATGILLKAMEDHRQDFVVILAGYEEQMTKLIASNEGFSSRIKHTIYFPDYTETEMLNIFNSFISNYNGKSYVLNEDAKDVLLKLFALEKKSKSFGNARTVRNAVDGIMDYYADRNIINNVEFNIIEIEDVEKYVNDRNKILQHELKNYSASNQLDESIIRLSELKSKLKDGSNNPDEDLSHFIGLESFKKEIESLKSQKEFYNQNTQQKILLLGPNGCGKSSITRILTGYLYQLGYIQENKYLEISAEFMKGSYVGHTSKRAESIISYASGGVLYIKNYNILFESNDSFSGEAISAINTAINENNNVTIILSDYNSSNIDAIKNMFTLVYEFPNYTNEQLLQIFDMLIINQNFSITNDARDEFWTYLNNHNLKIKDVQYIFNNSLKQHIANFNGNESTKFVLSKDDLTFPIYDNINESSTNLKTKIKLNFKSKN